MLFHCCQAVLPFLSLCLSQYDILMLNFILLECFVNNRCIYPLPVNFFYEQVNYLLKYWRKTFFILLFKKYFEQIFFFAFAFFIKKFRIICIALKIQLFFIYYIIVSNLKADILLIKSQFYCIYQVATLVIRKICIIKRYTYNISIFILI